jgi:hypothetical protein
MPNFDVDLSTIFQLIVRHVLTSAGFWLAGHGYLDSSAVQGFVGAGLILWGIGWSVLQKNGVVFLAAEKARLEKIVAIYSRQTQQHMAQAQAAQGSLPGSPTPSPGTQIKS